MAFQRGYGAMISVRLKRPKFLEFAKVDDSLVSFFCPVCDEIITHMLSEITPVYCTKCQRMLPNIKGLMLHKVLRANWHFGGNELMI